MIFVRIMHTVYVKIAIHVTSERCERIDERSASNYICSNNIINSRLLLGRTKGCIIRTPSNNSHQEHYSSPRDVKLSCIRS